MGNRLKGQDLIECLINYERRFVTLYRRKGARPSPKKRNAKKPKKKEKKENKQTKKKRKKAKWLSEEALPIAVKRSEANSKG